MLITGVSQTQVQQLELSFVGDDGADVDSCNLVQVAGSQAGGLLATLCDTVVAVLAHPVALARN